MWEPLHECSSTMSAGFSQPEEYCNSCQRVTDKENIPQQFGSSPMKHESDLSLYGSPAKMVTDGCSPTHCTHRRRPLEDHDANSLDSGYGASFSSRGDKFFRLARSLGVTPRPDCSPAKTYSTNLSFGSMDSMDDVFLEFTNVDTMPDQKLHLPADFNSLITGTFAPAEIPKDDFPDYVLPFKPPIRRSLSLNTECLTPNSRRVRSCLFKPVDNEVRPFKRPDPPGDVQSPVLSKRTKLEEPCEDDEMLGLAAVPETSYFSRPVLRRSFSATEESIKYALQRSSTEPDLIGDFTVGFSLPLTTGRHQDLKSITPAVLAMLMRGVFADKVACYQVIDCRYPYEYEGGHIDGAVNIYTKEQVLDKLLNVHVDPPTTAGPIKRNILVFHCEFSSERGPNLYRCLRNLDRNRNKDVYPALYYPEVYLLEGGYKNFFQQHPTLCVPVAYTPMLHPQHQNDLRYFRAKSRTADRLRPTKSGLKRLGFD